MEAECPATARRVAASVGMSGEAAQSPRPSRVVLMCGVAGAGKTTYAKELEAQGYARLSIDEEVWERFGRYGVDYDPSMYEKHSAETEAVAPTAHRPDPCRTRRRRGLQPLGALHTRPA